MPSGRRRPPVAAPGSASGSTGSTHGESAVPAPATSANRAARRMSMAACDRLTEPPDRYRDVAGAGRPIPKLGIEGRLLEWPSESHGAPLHLPQLRPPQHGVRAHGRLPQHAEGLLELRLRLP